MEEKRATYEEEMVKKQMHHEFQETSNLEGTKPAEEGQLEEEKKLEEETNMEEESQLEEEKQLEEEEKKFERELADLMAQPSGKKKQKKQKRQKKNGEKKNGENDAEEKKRRPWSRKRKIAAAAAVIVIGIAGISCLGGRKGQSAVPVTTIPISKGVITEELTISGPVSGTDSVDVVSNLHSEVIDIRVKEGDRVEQGAVLAVIDDSDVRKEVDMAQNTYDLAVSTYKEQQILAENGYAKALQELEAAQKDFDRTNVLFQAGSVSQLELETARDTLNNASRELKTFTLKDGKPVANESYTLQIKNAEFELEKKKEQLEDTSVTSPISGTVVRVNAKVGRFADTIEDDKPMFIIENLDELEMKVNVSEYSIGKITVGQEAVISADILGGSTVRGQVTAISPTGEEKGGGSTERVIPTTIRIMDDNTRLIAGITAKAKIILNEAQDAWIIPISAVLETDEGSYVLAVDQGTIRKIPVETGVESDIQMQIIPQEEESLTEGMSIVASPSADFTEGMKVTEIKTGN